ncbi:MAG: amidohydrolase family protein [Syntrophales bacterium]|jgi:predicted TIM-barrel fold metal-dependent hydrolase|nr:amidohydrolase family protein [Syntrophales bacterium]
MLIVDSQVHIWGANTPERPWPQRARAQREIPLGHEELLHEMDAAGVDRAVIVPPSWEGDRNDLAIAAVQSHPERFAIMGRFNPEAPDAREAIKGWRNQPGMLGMRFSFHIPSLLQPLIDGKYDWVWSEAEKREIVLMMIVPQKMIQIIDGVAVRHPGLKLVMDHMALTSGRSEEETFREFDKLLRIAERPNVSVKASALPNYIRDEYPFKKIQVYVRKAYEAFGPKRTFWGSDLSRSPCPYRQHIDMWLKDAPWLREEDKEWIMGRGICEWLGWRLS